MSSVDYSGTRWCKLAIRLSAVLRDKGFTEDSDRIVQIAESGEYDIANYDAMRCLIKQGISISLSDYRMLEMLFSNSPENEYLDRNYHYSVDPDEAEVFKKLKLDDE